MGRADYEGLIRYSTEQHLADEAVDTQMARVVLNNALHLADEDGQVLVALPPSSFSSVYDELAFSGATDPVLCAAYGPMPARLKGTFDAYPVRVRMYADLSAGSSTCKAWIVYGPLTTAKAAIDAGGTDVCYGSPTTTAGWLTLMDADGTTVTSLDMTPADIVRGVRTLSTIDAVAGNDTSSVMVEAYISVWVEGLTGAATFQMRGLYVAEYYG